MVPNSRTHMNDILGQPWKASNQDILGGVLESQDTSEIRTLLVVPKVSVLYMFHCTACT